MASDDKMDLNIGDWVEFADTAYLSRGEPLPLLRIEEVDLPGRRVRLSGEPDPSVGRRPASHPFLRRWDRRSAVRHASGTSRTKQGAAKLRNGAIRVEEGGRLPLEDGVFVYVEPGRTYGAGDFWAVAARTVTGGVERPTDAARRPLVQAPYGRHTHYAPPARVLGEGSVADLRLAFAPLSSPVPAADAEALAADETYEAEAAAAEKEATGDPGSRRAAQDEGQPEN